MVAAYKGLLKEKEALESSLAVLSSPKNDATPATDNASGSASTSSAAASATAVDVAAGTPISGEADELQMQIATVMQSLATLSAEKSKMEASFQADKRNLRAELQHRDRAVAELQEKLKGAHAQSKLEVEKAKSKLIIERHEWEKESSSGR